MTIKRPGSMSDADRSLARRHTPGRGVPVEIDPEVTPPPQEPPEPSSLTGYETIPTPIREQLNMLAHGLGEATAAIGKVWDARKDGERLDRIDSKLATLAEYATKHQTMLHEFVMPAIKECMSSTDAVAMQLPKMLAQLEAVTMTVGNIDRQVRAIELEMRTSKERAESDHRALAALVAAQGTALSDQENRLDSLERKERDREVVSRALAKAERRKSGAVGGTVAAVVSGIVAIIAKLMS